MGVEISKKTNFIITIRYEIPSFLSVGPFFKEGGSRKFRPEAKILGIFSIEVAPNSKCEHVTNAAFMYAKL